VTAVLTVPAPAGIIQRIGSRRHGGALAWPSLDWLRSPRDGSPAGGTNRFDDPRGGNSEYTVLYASPLRIACFAETLDHYRVRVDNSRFAAAVAATVPLSSDDELNFDAGIATNRTVADAPRTIPAHYFETKEIGFFEIVSPRPFLDVRRSATQTADALSLDPAMTIRPIKPGDFAGDNRAKTQAISLWAFHQGYGGIVYTSSHDLGASWECVALFPWTEIRQVRPPVLIDRSDPDLVQIAARFSLTTS
jgi:hypothetical protein